MFVPAEGVCRLELRSSQGLNRRSLNQKGRESGQKPITGPLSCWHTDLGNDTLSSLKCASLTLTFVFRAS